MSEWMIACYTEPDTARLLLEKCSELLMNYAKALKATGVGGVVIAEPAAGLLPNEDCSAYSSAYLKPIVDAVQDDEFLVVLHNCGNTGHCTTASLETGASAYHFGNKIDMVQALNELPPTALAMGNLDPVGVFKSASPEEVKRQTLELLQRTAKYPNFVLSSGCDVPPHTPQANIEAFYAALEERQTLRG
jgi:uroporphyrinogen decarboxylase